MKQIIIDEANKIFTVFQKAGVAQEFESLFNKKFLSDFEKKLESSKKAALKTRFGVKFDQSLWDETFQIRKALIWPTIEYALDKNKAIMLDWRASAEDAVYNIKNLVPNVDIKSLGEVEKLGVWYEPIEIDSKIIDLKSEDEELLIDRVIRSINMYLKIKFDLLLLTTDLGGDNHYYLLVPVASEKDFVEYGFYRP